MGFCYQINTHFSQAVGCGREEFWKSVRDSSNQWKIDSRRDILDVVERHDEKGIARWLKNTEYQKYLARKRGLKSLGARQKFFSKTNEERLLAFAQELKDNLIALIFSCREFDATESSKGKPFRHRRLADCHLNGLVMLDIDHVDNPLEVFEALKAHEELMQRTALVHITSSRKGIRIVFTADIKCGNLADNQMAFAQTLGYQADSSCIDATRNSFAPKEEDILFIDEEKLFDYYDGEFDKKYTPMYREGKTQPNAHPQPQTHPQPLPSGRGVENPGAAAPLPSKGGVGVGSETSSGVGSETSSGVGGGLWHGYDLQKIIDARYAEKLPCAADSNRHNESLKLASDLLILLDGDKLEVQRIVEAQPWVREIIDERDEDVGKTVESAAQRMAEKEKKYLTQLPSKAMQTAIEEATGKTYQEIVQAQTQASAATPSIDSQLNDWGAQIEAMSEEYPILKDITKGLKRNQYPAALFVGGGLLMTLMTRCTYRFYHRPEELRRLNNSTLIIGDPASGKSFATRLFKLLAAPIVAADKAGRDAINAYREQVKTKGANKEKPQKPKVVVRVHPARTSNAQFIQDMVNAVEVVDGEEMQLHMLTFDTELDNTVTVQKGGSWIDKQSMELKAFHNEEDGQAYSNVDSVLQDFYVTWNYIYTGTPIALKKKVNEQNFGSGLATRLTCIPLPATNFEMMERESHVDYDSDLRLKQWAFKLDRMKGELSVGKLVDELYDWTARRMMDASDNDSRADEMLLKRCAYHGLNFSAPFIVMRHWDKMHQDGTYWCGEFETDDVDWRLCELLTNIQYACQRHYFGRMAEAYFDNKERDANVNVQRRQKTYEGFSRLPEEFNFEDVMRCFNLSSEGAARKMCSRLQSDHLIKKVCDGRGNEKGVTAFQKTGVMMV